MSSIRNGELPPEGFGWVYTCSCARRGLILNVSGSLEGAARACLSYTGPRNSTCGGIVNPTCDPAGFVPCENAAFACGPLSLPSQCNLVRLPPNTLGYLTTMNILALCLVLFGFGTFGLAQWLRDKDRLAKELKDMRPQVAALNRLYTLHWSLRTHPKDPVYRKVDSGATRRRPGFGFVRGRVHDSSERRTEEHSAATDTATWRSAMAVATPAPVDDGAATDYHQGGRVYVAAGDASSAPPSNDVVVRDKQAPRPEGVVQPCAAATDGVPVARRVDVDFEAGGDRDAQFDHGKEYIRAPSSTGDPFPPVLRADLDETASRASNGKMYMRTEHPATRRPAETRTEGASNAGGAVVRSKAERTDAPHRDARSEPTPSGGVLERKRRADRTSLSNHPLPVRLDGERDHDGKTYVGVPVDAPLPPSSKKTIKGKTVVRHGEATISPADEGGSARVISKYPLTKL